MSLQTTESAIGELDRSILDYPRNFRTDKGKFIRIGELILVGPFVLGSRQLYHADLFRIALSSHFDTVFEQMQAQVLRAEHGRGSLKTNELDDAGYFYLSDDGLTEQGLPDLERAGITASVRVKQRSTGYGAASLAGRLYTGEVFGRQLGSDIKIFADLATE